MSPPAECCSRAEHERLKRDSQFPKLEQIGVQRFADIALELANCSKCQSTLAREVEK